MDLVLDDVSATPSAMPVCLDVRLLSVSPRVDQGNLPACERLARAGGAGCVAVLLAHHDQAVGSGGNSPKTGNLREVERDWLFNHDGGADSNGIDGLVDMQWWW